ncbi:MAG: hypothetical protein H7Y00_08725 [Fimbriimonadaceae bacterium]|nr:hypothetical protein [Chitinophagales bacterium]
MNTIKNIQDLHTEIHRLRQLKEEQEKTLRSDIMRLQEALEPANLMSQAATAIFKGSLKPNVIKSGLDLGLEFIIEKILFRKSGAITKFIAGIIIRNLAKFFSKENKIEWPAFIKGIADDFMKEDETKKEDDE